MARYARKTFRSGRYNNGIVRRRGKGRYVFLLCLISSLIMGGILLFKVLNSKTYSDEDSFIEYAISYFKDNRESNDFGKEYENFQYGKPLSVAMNYALLNKPSLDKNIKNTVEKRKNTFLGNHEKAIKEEKIALLMSYSTYDGTEDIGGLVLKSVTKEENKKGKLVDTEAYIDTFLFYKDTGNIVYPIMIFESGYQKLLSKYITEKLEDDYKDDLNKEYKKYLDPKKNKFNNFILDKDTAVFYFGQGTVTDKGKVIEIRIGKNDIKGLFRDKLSSRKIDPDKPMVALTYDDGPHPVYSEEILDILKENETVATFFEVGRNIDNIKKSSKILKRIEEEGSELGSHSYTHPNLLTLTKEKVKEENDKTDKAFKNAIGHAPSIYRPPYGNANNSITEIFGKASIGWSIDTFDWKDRNKDSVIEQIKSSGNLDGKVILMHSIYSSTVEASREVIPWLKSEGYQIVTVSELLMYKYNEDPKQIRAFDNAFFSTKPQKDED